MHYFKLFLCRDEISLNPRSGLSAESMLSLLKSCRRKFSDTFSFDVTYVEDMEENVKESVLEEIRILSRRECIGVVSKANSGALPISRRKKMGREGILLCYTDDVLTDVYPHTNAQRRADIVPFLQSVLDSEDLSERQTPQSLQESDISRMISSFPDMIDENVSFFKNEVEIPGGRIDSVFRTKDGGWLLVEIEIYAKSIAIEQILKFRNSFSEAYHVDPEKIRLALVCGRIKDSTLRASLSSGIEVYVLNLKRIF